MARVPDLGVRERHDLKMITVADLIEYRRRTEKLVERVVAVRCRPSTASSRRSPTRAPHRKQHVALGQGRAGRPEDVLVRVHSECLTGDVFHSLRCDCGEQLELALAQIGHEGRASSSTWPRKGAGSVS